MHGYSGIIVIIFFCGNVEGIAWSKHGGKTEVYEPIYVLFAARLSLWFARFRKFEFCVRAKSITLYDIIKTRDQ